MRTKTSVYQITAGLLFCISLMLSAQVKILNEPLPLDGNLTGNAWGDVPEQTGFQYLKGRKQTNSPVQTSFKVAADRENLYMSILCREPQMQKVNVSPNGGRTWGADSIEVFLAPSGQTDEFYQFIVAVGGDRYSMFYREAGNVKPDPYLPFWESKVFYGKDYWLVQLRLPFSAFYMTRNQKWNSEWLLNIARSRIQTSELTSWSPLKNAFREPHNFRKFKGFPKRSPMQDIVISSANPIIKNFVNGVYSGPLHLTIEANPAAAGKYELLVEEQDGKSSVHSISLKGGLNQVVLENVEYLGKIKRNNKLKLVLKAAKGGTEFGRYYPINIVYQPLRIELTSPGYKMNFYPGQDYSTIRGQLLLNLSSEQKKHAEVKISVSGGGVEEKTLTLKADREIIPFQFDSSKLTEDGKVQLTAKIIEQGKETAAATCRVARLKKNTGSMIWIENNVLIKNGKPWYPRYIYAYGYRGGTAFKERYNADQLGEAKFRMRSLEPALLIPGIETREAVRDVKPCPELFAKVRKIVEQEKSNPTFDFYYISDEPEYRHISPVYLKYIYDFVSELDPYHPVLSCTTGIDKYLQNADIFAVHPYLAPTVSDGKRILGCPVARIRFFLDKMAQFKRLDKVVGFTGQFFCYKSANELADYPTWEELESMSWSAIVHGSRFHYPYAYHDLGDRPQLYEGYRYLNQSIEALESLLLSNRKYPVKAVDPENMIDTLLVEDGNATLLIVVNLKNGPLDTVISAEHLKKFHSLLEFRGNGSREIVNGELKLSLKPYECVVLTSKKLDDGLKTRDQVVKEITEQNQARAARGNLLFEKGNSFEVDSSNSGRNTQTERSKLFDGTVDMLGWQSKAWTKNHWYELNFRKNPPKFSKIGLFGYNMGNPVVKIWKFGEWKNLIPKKTQKAQYSILWDFGEELKSVKVRFEFTSTTASEPVELYEIELLK